MNEPTQPEKKPETVRSEVANQIATLLLSGLGLVAALAWNGAILALFDTLFPAGDGLIYKFGYAVVVTVVIVIVSMRLKKFFNRP